MRKKEPNNAPERPMETTKAEVTDLPSHVEDLHKGEGHGDETQHEVWDGQVDDENVTSRSHRSIPDHNLLGHIQLSKLTCNLFS